MLASFFAENQRIAIPISRVAAPNGRHLFGVSLSRPSARVALRFVLQPIEPRLIVMGHALRPATSATLVAAALTVASVGTVLHAAPVTINGATFDAPASCQAADGALVCKVDGQQMELWVKRKPLAADIKPTDSLVRKMAYFNELHQSAVSGIMRATANDKSTPFTNYGKYSALGAAMAGKGIVTSPTVRFASVLQGDEVWEFMEVVAARTPGIEALSADLQRSLVLPAVPPPATAKPPEPPKPVAADATVATYSGALLSFQYPLFLEAVVTEDSASGLSIGLKHKAREGGPNVTISLRKPKDAQTNAASAIAQRKQASTSAMMQGSASVEISKLGPIIGAGYALIGVPDAKKGFSGVESVETAFAGSVGDRLLEVRLTAEQKYSKDMEAVWALLSESIKPAK